MKIRWPYLALAPVVVLLTAADLATVELTTPMVYRPSVAPHGQAVYKRGGALLTAPLLWQRAASLTQSVSIGIGGDTQTIAAGRMLGEVSIGGIPSLGGENLTAYCTGASGIGSNTVFSGLGKVGATVGGALGAKPTGKKYCVVDSDKDGRADKGFVLIGPGSSRSVQSIAPTPLTIRPLVPASSGADELMIKFLAAGPNELMFILQVKQDGQYQNFATLSAGGYSAPSITRVKIDKGWPQKVAIYGVEFSVIGYDRATDSVSIAWPEAQSGAAVPVPTAGQVAALYY